MGKTEGKAGKTLPSKVKICTSCHRMKDKERRWLPMSIVSIPSRTKFSYCICPDCRKKMKMKLQETKNLSTLFEK